MTLTRVRKQVRFYEVVLLDRHEAVVDIEPTFWVELWKTLAHLPPADRLLSHLGSRYAGEHRVAKAPAQEYVKFGKIRNRSDWPDTFDAQTVSFGTLISVGGNDDGSDLGLAESAYLIHVPGTNYVAVLASGRAVNLSALESWITQVAGNIRQENALQLLPVLDEKTLNKLERASSVTKVNVRVPRGVTRADLAVEGEVGSALAQATAATLGEMDVEITWTMGRSRGVPSQPTAARILRALRTIVGGKEPVSKVSANLLIEDAEGVEQSEPVDFIRQRISFAAQFDVDQDQAVPEESALRGMLRAIDRLRDEVL